MSAKSFSVLAFASAALAVPHAQWKPFNHHGHGHHHGGPPGYGSESESAAPTGYSSPVAPVSGSGTGAPYPYPTANSTGIYGSTGTGYATGLSSSVYPTAPVPSGMPSPVGPATESSVTSYGAQETDCSSDVTITTTETETVYYTPGQSSSEVSPVSGSASSTVYLTSTYTAPAGYSASSSEVSAAGFSSSSKSVVHVTSTYTTTPGGYSYSSPASSPVAPVSSSVYSAPYTSVPAPQSYSVASSSSPVAPESTSYSAPVSYSAPSSSSVYVAPTTSTSVYVAPTTSSSSSAAATPTTYASGFRGKRGLAYNDASLTDCLSSSDKVGWAYNWGSDSSGFSNSDIMYIPTLWGPTSDFTPSWNDNANAAIQAGAQFLMSFNEPDNPSQSNLSPEEAATAWKQYMEPFAGKAKLVAPSVTNGGGSMGLDWLSAFLTACSDCTIDVVNQHWYDSTSNDAEYFKQQITNATTVSGKPVIVSEFGAIGSDSDISTFLEDVMPWMDSQDSVLGYAYFMVSDGLLVSGSEPSSYGSTFANYS